jgi:hypothetical protein
MKNLEELKIAKDYYKAKYRYIQMKIKKLESESTIEYKKTIVEDMITIEPISEAEQEPEPEPESDNTVSLFFTTQIINDDKAKIKRSDCYNRYVIYCESHQLEPKQKSIFFEDIEAFIGKPKKSNVYCYKNYRFVESDTPLTFNQSIEQLIF